MKMKASTMVTATSQQNEQSLIKRLCEGDEQTFSSLIRQYHSDLVYLAMKYVSRREIAEEVVQETWLGVLRGIQRFEGRSSLKTWLFNILVNQARTSGKKERSYSKFMVHHDAETSDSTNCADVYDAIEKSTSFDDKWKYRTMQGHTDRPEECILRREMREVIEQKIEALPTKQRTIITLCDLEGWTAEEICSMLDIRAGNQRVYLHRARVKVRVAMQDYLNT